MALNGPYGIDAVGGTLLEEVYRTFTAFLTDSLGTAPRWSSTLGLFESLPTRGAEAKAKVGSVATGVHEWVSGREMGQFIVQEKSVPVQRWHSGMSLDMDDLDDDDLNLGLMRRQAADVAWKFEEHKHQLLVTLLKNGNVSGNTSYDGKLFFATDHTAAEFRSDGGQAGVTSWSNLETGALTETTLYASIVTMSKARTPNGVIADVNPTHIIAPQALRPAIDRLIKTDFLQDASSGASKSNVLKNALTPIYDARLDADSATAYYLWDSTQALKPMFMADRVPVTTYVDQTAAADRQLVYGAWARYAMGYAFPHAILKSTGV